MNSVSGACVVLVKKLSPQVSKSDLVKFFEDVGKVTQVQLGRDSITGDPTGTAYCAFQTKEEGGKALELRWGPVIGRTCWNGGLAHGFVSTYLRGGVPD